MLPVVMHAPNISIDLAALNFPLMVSEKLDGWRGLFAGGQILTKNCRVQPNRNLWHHFRELLDLGTRELWVFDCEIYSPSMTLEQIQGILQSPDGDPSGLTANVFDCLTAREYFANSKTMSYRRRYARYIDMIGSRRPANTVAVLNRVVGSVDELMSYYHDVLDAGGEGLVVRHPGRSYCHGRCKAKSDMMYKLKSETITGHELPVQQMQAA